MEFNNITGLPSIIVFVRKRCKSSNEMIKKILQSPDTSNRIQIKIYDIDSDTMPSNYQIPAITPAVCANGEILKYGNFDFNNWLENYLSRL